jgi:glucose/arabinose dehydrogenase
MKKLIQLLSITILLSINKMFAQSPPLPSNYSNTTVVSGLAYPADFDVSNDGRYFITLKGGNTSGACANGKIFVYSAAGTLIGTFYDLTDSVNCDFERGLLGIALDPDFDNNHYVYAYYVHKFTYGVIPNQVTKNASRIMRFTENNNVGTNPTIILNISVDGLLNVNGNAISVAGNHFGGILRFRPSQPDKIYLQLGDLAYNQGNATLNMANKLNYPFGKILRINSDGTIPTDNPFYDDGNPATGNDDRIWTYGNRNMFGMCFNEVTDSMYSSENGWNAWDEFNIVHKGGNYGWATCEGNFMNSSSTTPCNLTGDVRPIATWSNPPGLTGCLFYTHSLMPEFQNHILVADNDNGKVYDLTMGNAPAYDIVTSNTTFADLTATGGLTALKVATDGCILAMKGGYTTTGAIYRICPVGMSVNPNSKAENIIGQTYPNPSNGITNVDFSLAQTADVLIELFDITGRKIQQVINQQNVSEGKHTVSIGENKNLKAGTYFYTVTVSQKGKTVYTQTKKMIVSN